MQNSNMRVMMKMQSYDFTGNLGAVLPKEYTPLYQATPPPQQKRHTLANRAPSHWSIMFTPIHGMVSVDIAPALAPGPKAPKLHRCSLDRHILTCRGAIFTFTFTDSAAADGCNGAASCSILTSSPAPDPFKEGGFGQSLGTV